MTWEICVPKGEWTTQIKDAKKRMKDAGVPPVLVKIIASGNASMADYCFSLRKFGERLNEVHPCRGMKPQVKQLRKLCNWAAHDRADTKYKHTTVNHRHMKRTLSALNAIADTLIAEEEDPCADLSTGLDALRLY